MWDDTYDPAEDRRQAWQRLRHKAIALLEAGHTPVTVAAGLGVHPSTVRDWRARYRRGGLDALRVGKPPGNQRRKEANRTCEQCGGTFYAKPVHIRQGWGRFCSVRCRHAAPNYGRGI